MTPDGALLNSGEPHDLNDIGPVFINSDFNGPGDLGDWWLDLGHIDLPA